MSRRRWEARAAFLLAVPGVAACAYPAPPITQFPNPSPGPPERSVAGLKDEPLGRGDSHSFAEDYEAVASAALEAVQEVGLELAEDYSVNDSTWMILCGMSEFLKTSAVVRVVVQRLWKKQTEVRVISLRSQPLALWGKGDYSQDIFDSLIEKLEEWPQRPKTSPAAPSPLEDILGQRSFESDFEAVVSATREGVQEVGITLRNDYPVDDDAWVILCEKYAQSLRVVVQRLGKAQTAVRVISRRRRPTDLLKMEDYSQDIFSALIEKIEGQPHIFAVDYEALVLATREAVKDAEFEVRGGYPVNDSTWVIVCAKHARFLRVVVQRLGEKQTAVRVIFRRGEGVELWRMEDYSPPFGSVSIPPGTLSATTRASRRCSRNE